MRTAVLIAVLGAVGLSAFLWSGTVEAQVRPPQKLDPCMELRLQIEAGTLGPVASWPREQILLGLFCTFQGDPNPLVIHTAVAQVDATALTLGGDHQAPPVID
jgi:hypothetical protein